jgi:hypothetical protein
VPIIHKFGLLIVFQKSCYSIHIYFFPFYSSDSCSTSTLALSPDILQFDLLGFPTELLLDLLSFQFQNFSLILDIW